MRTRSVRILAVMLIFSMVMALLPASTFAVTVEEFTEKRPSTLVDFIAGAATAEDIYGALDKSTVPEIIDYEEAVAQNHIARLYADEGANLNKVIFLNIDGSKTMYTFDFPVKYVDDKGNTQDISLKIAADTENEGSFKTAANSAVTTFSAQFTDGISLTGNDAKIHLIPILPSVSTGTLTMSATSNATVQRVDEKTVVYPYDAKTTVEYSLTYTGFKEDIVVSEYTGQTEYPFRLLTNGLSLEEIDGSFFLVDEKGNIKASIGDIIIFTADERNNTFGDIEAVTVRENQEYILNIVVDAEYLADPATVYPIRIDPTIKINYNYGAGAVEDITISTNTNYSGTYDYLFVGRRQTEGIARILLRFPGLDVSELAGATVTSAYVRIRDMMCEDDPLDVSCHIFIGSEWSESSATWANCSPNSYVTTPLSTNTLKWSIGDTFSNKHWYQFDVTEAVQGWIDGNYSQNKGLIFKVADSVENGDEILNRTFGSYNRTNYRPSLTVNYTEPGVQYIDNGTYYLNNQGRGKFVQINTAGADTVVSGLLSELGTSIQWQIQKVGAGYVIRSATDSTKYLSGATLQSDSSVNITTVVDMAIPDTCYWSITAASVGGCMIRNLANGRYLASRGTYLYTSNNTDTYGSVMYENFVWRLAPIWYYGNTSEHDTQELEDGFSIKDVVVNIDETATATVDAVPNNALWVRSSDFTFTHISGTYEHVSIALPKNSFYGTDAGIATYSATHKVTGRTTTFKVYVDRYTYELTREFGFSDSDALLIRKVYDRVNVAYLTESTFMRAWIATRSLGGMLYDGPNDIKTELWKQVAGNVCTGYEEQFFTVTLGFTTTQYQQLRTAIDTNHNDDEYSDFAHMQIALAGRLAYVTGQNGMLTETGVIWSEEDISYLCGWLGDAVISEDGTTVIKNDDYHADLDAENIFRLINQSKDVVTAINEYYTALTQRRTRATLFLTCIDYATVKAKIYEELIDRNLRYLLSVASQEGNIPAVEMYLEMLESEEYHINTIRQRYPDTYNFMCSLRDGCADIAAY